MTRATGTDGRPAVTIFWSWQSDLAAEATRTLVDDCLQRVAKGMRGTHVVAVDRDTKGMPGTPSIADTILRKIVAADVFVWDASIVTSRWSVRPSPNPNVLFELGFAVAALGWDRIVGVINTRFGSPELLPFDLKHRRWPITYSLDARPSWRIWERASWTTRRSEVRKGLERTLANAVVEALRAPRGGPLRIDPDLAIARRFWVLMPSSWVHEWHEARESYPQYEQRQRLDVFQEYAVTARRPELRFTNLELREAHENVIEAISAYLVESARHRVRAPNTKDEYVISTQVQGYERWIEDYDRRYAEQLSIVEAHARAVWDAWSAYVALLRAQHPAVVFDDEQGRTSAVEPGIEVNAETAIVMNSRQAVVVPCTLLNRATTATTIASVVLEVGEQRFGPSIPVDGLVLGELPFRAVGTGIRIEPSDSIQCAFYFGPSIGGEPVDIPDDESWLRLMVDSVRDGKRTAKLAVTRT